MACPLLWWGLAALSCLLLSVPHVAAMTTANYDPQLSPDVCSRHAELAAHYTCDFRLMSKPTFCTSLLEEPPQHLTLTGLSAVIPVNFFEEFQWYSSSDILRQGDPIELVLDCGGQTLLLQAGCFAGLQWLQRLSFVDCHILELTRKIFSDIGRLDSLEFHAGSIDDIDYRALKDLTIEESSDLTEPHGQFYMKHTRLHGRRLAPNFFTHTGETIRSITIIDADIFLLDSALFQELPKLTSLDLSRNAFKYLPYGIFNQSNALSYLTLYGIPFDCSTCEAAWFLKWAEPRGCHVMGDLLCDSPEEHQNVRMQYFLSTSCTEEQSDTEEGTGIGLWLLDEWVAGVDLMNFCLACGGILLCLCQAANQIVKSKKQARNVPPGGPSRGMTMINLSLMENEREWLSNKSPTPQPQDSPDPDDRRSVLPKQKRSGGKVSPYMPKY